MSRAVLISIHPEHVANILSGVKVFEYRRVMPTQDVSHLVLYCTAPVKRVVAVAEVAGRLKGPPSRIWAETAYGAGITRKFYRDYFSGQSSAGSFVLGNVYKLSEPLELADLSSCSVPPQSFGYLNERDVKLVLKKVSSIPSTPASMIFVGGVHGVGKTTMCQKAFTPLGYRCVTASSLIVEHGGLIDKSKRVNDVSGNQAAIIKQLAMAKKIHCRLLLDGHFAVVNDRGRIEPIDLSIFQEINPTHLILVKGNPGEVTARLNKRDGKKWQSSFIKSFQMAEELHARKVSDALTIPLSIVFNDSAPAVVAKIISSQHSSKLIGPRSSGT